MYNNRKPRVLMNAICVMAAVVMFDSMVNTVHCESNNINKQKQQKQKLYSKFTNEYIGVIIDEKSKHLFPNGKTESAVIIKYKDGSKGHLPKRSINTLYISK